MDKRIPDWERVRAWYPVKTPWGWKWLTLLNRRLITQYMRDNLPTHSAPYPNWQKYIWTHIDD